MDAVCPHAYRLQAVNECRHHLRFWHPDYLWSKHSYPLSADTRRLSERADNSHRARLLGYERWLYTESAREPVIVAADGDVSHGGRSLQPLL